MDTIPVNRKVWHPDIPPAYRDNITVIDALAGLRSLPDASIPLFLFSPPYNLGTSTGGGIQAYRSHYNTDKPLGRRGGAARWKGGELAGGYGDYNDAMPHDEYVQWQKDILAECWRCLTERGAIFYNHKPRILDGVLVDPLDYVPADLRRYVRQRIIWDRGGGVNATPAFYMSTHECVVIIARPAWRLRDQSASGIGDVWRIAPKSNTWHPAPFPLSLALRIMETTAAPLVCDPFMGSGTVAKAAKMCGASFIGFERNANYANRALAEIEAVQPMVFEPELEQLAIG